MSFDQNVFAHEILNESLWWRFSVDDEQQPLVLSRALAARFDHVVNTIDDLTGRFPSTLIPLKIQEILQAPNEDVRFVAAYDTLAGKKSFQHQLKILNESGQRYVWTVCVDVTEMTEFEREIVDAQGRLSLTQLYEHQALLQEQNRVVNDAYQKQSKFLAMLSHELRSPLLGICSLVERLREDRSDKKALIALNTIHMTAELSTFLVNDILTYSQTEYDEIKLHPMTFSLKEVLDNVKQLTKSIAADKGLIVSLVYVGHQDRVEGDSVRLSQVLINLIINSIKFTEFGGVTVEVTEEPGNRFIFRVTDSGEGMSESYLERIFEPFAQLESQGSTQELGSGLGLFVVKQLVSLMGGSISVKSTLGLGTVFQFELPLAGVVGDLVAKEADESTTVEPDLSTESSTQVFDAPIIADHNAIEPLNVMPTTVSADYKILVADDSQINRMVLAGYFEDLNCDVVEAKDGKQAWDLFQKNQFDYVFLDIQMPFMDGIQVSRKIQESVQKNNEHGHFLKGVYAITAGGEESNFIPTGESLQSIGFDQWFVKPVSKAQIIGLLQSNEGQRHSIELKDDAFENETLDRILLDEPVSFAVDHAHQHTIEQVPEQFHALIDEFLSEANANVTNLQAHNQSNDWPELAKKAHYLKGNCMLFQLDTMVDLIKLIEDLAEESGDTRTKQEKINKALEKLRYALKYLEKSTTIGHNTT